MLRQRVAKLDPAQKALRFRGFKESSLTKRIELIEKILKEIGIGLGEKPEFTCEHVYTQKSPNARVLNDMVIVTFPSRSLREIVLKEVENKPPGDISRADLKIDRAKPASQLARNSALRRAVDVLKKDARCTSQEV